eukprot:NODE_84_length_22349_cov_0.357888.p15 type:complete len:108 gc:universal NODE_84_length_22349_cov_0.357888:5927-6250(+)
MVLGLLAVLPFDFILMLDLLDPKLSKSKFSDAIRCLCVLNNKSSLLNFFNSDLGKTKRLDILLDFTSGLFLSGSYGTLVIFNSPRKRDGIDILSLLREVDIVAYFQR